MNKSDLIKQVSSDTGFTIKECEVIFNSIMRIIISNLKIGHKISITNFGTFHQVHYKQRNIRNIGTSELQKNTPSISISFKASENLKKTLKE